MFRLGDFPSITGSSSSYTRSLLVGGLSTAAVTYGLFRLWKWRNAQQDWFPVGRVAELFVHPIKSSRGISVFHLDCELLGSRYHETHDRQFVIYEPLTNRFVTARQEPKIVLIDACVENDTLRLAFPGSEKNTLVPLGEVRTSARVCKVTLHGQLRADGLDCGDEAASFVQSALDRTDIRLALFSQGLTNERQCKPLKEWSRAPQPKRVDNVMYADLAPFMLATNASLHDLNAKLAKPVTMRNFRPNIVVENRVAWDEDRWAEVRIGDVHFECFKPCTRCVLTTVDPDVGEKHPEMQPLAKLREYRLAPDELRKVFKESPVFGTNAGVRRQGRVHIGQTVYVRYKQRPF